ncbi:MAG: hypothetical protein B1H07_01055 [Campylobacteraceae bacterium 4484_166]|nr:MAG: hypothetical protein B1H07_01055 [Campylobacteraceae bacterium 4484_166]
MIKKLSLFLLLSSFLFADAKLFFKDNRKSIHSSICTNIILNNYKIFDKLSQKKLLIKIYRKNCTHSHGLLWFDKYGNFNANFVDALELIKNNPKYNYIKKSIINNSIDIVNSDKLYTKSHDNIDIQLTNAVLKEINNIYYGKTKFYRMKRWLKNDREKFEWDYSKEKLNIANYLLNALKNNKLISSLKNLEPQYIQYKRLKKQLKLYQQIKKLGGWQKIKYGKTIKYKTKDYRISKIKKRLSLTDGFVMTNDDNLYNKALLVAVKRFQKRHGLEPDGRIGSSTISKMNISINKKIDIIKLNLERHRWLTHIFPKKYIEINIPSFRLNIVENHKSIYSTKIVVGKKERPSPIFTDRLSSFVINPYWRVPKSLVQKDILRHIMDDSTYIARNNIKITNKRGKRVSVTDVNWFEYDKDSNIPYRFRQEPGKKNALGLVKFLFPNRYAVYLHDTNHKSLFKKTNRAYSSGCIRVHKPFDLLTELNKDDSRYTNKNIKNHIKSKKNRHFSFKDKLKIYINYLTAYVGDDGLLYFYKDVYDYDRVQLRF